MPLTYKPASLTAAITDPTPLTIMGDKRLQDEVHAINAALAILLARKEAALKEMGKRAADALILQQLDL